MSPRQVLLLLSVAFWWGAAYVWAALALEGFTPFPLVALRLAIAALALALVLQLFGAGLRDAVRLFRARPAGITLLAVTTSAAPFTLITFGQREVPAGTTGVLIATVPLWTAALGIWLDRSETLGRRQAAGLVVGLTGVGLVVGAEAVHTRAQVVAAGLILLGACCVALGNFVAQRRFAGVPPLTRGVVTCVVSSALLVPGAAATTEVELGARPLIGLVGLGVCSTGLLLVLTFRLIDSVGSRRAALAAYLAPAFALLLAAIVLGDPITAGAVGGLALIVGGVVLASRPAPATPPATPEGAPIADPIPAYSSASTSAYHRRAK